MLCERNKFHCDNCGGLQEAEKRMKIKRLPRILALHLKRFKYTEDYNRLQKLFHRVDYPFHLRLFNTTDDAENSDRLYELYAVVVHIGGGPYHGHYVSIIKTQDRGWLLFDDELVEPVDKSYVQNFFGGEPKPGVQDAKQLACAYVLFYQETTLEAVQREQETENQPPIVPESGDGPLATAIPPGSPNGAANINNFWGNGLRQMQTVVTPTDEKDDQFASLAHAATAPSFSPNGRPQSETPGQNPLFPQVTNSKSKRDLKKEEKQAEKERKAAAKEAEKATIAKRRELFEDRRARLKQQEEDLNAAIEASKQSAAEEAGRAPLVQTSTTSTDGTTSVAPPGGGLSRFTRHSSMSLRQKPSFWPGKKAGGVGAVPEAPEVGEAERDKEREKKNRFSIGRKKSTAM